MAMARKQEIERAIAGEGILSLIALPVANRPPK
jgi:hypothetical protein